MSAEGDKTEEPTSKRLDQARRKGQVAFSRDLGGAVALATIFAVLTIGGSRWEAGLRAYLRVGIASAFGPSTGFAPFAALDLAAGTMLRATLVVALPAALVVIIVGLLQTRFLLSFEALRLDLGRVMPSPGRVFGLSGVVELGKGLVKVAIVGVIAFATLRAFVPVFANAAGSSVPRLMALIGTTASRLGFRLVIAVVALGVLDLLWQRWRYMRDQRMTREEVKREYKQDEGDPQHKAERQRLHRELLEQRMVADVRKADFVVVNPDHIAVALRYDRDRDEAPVVVAKGERLLAEQIKQVAREAGVPIFRDVTLARSLREVSEGDEIPEALFEVVAELLRVVRGLDGQQGTPATATSEASDANKQASPSSHWRRA